MMRPGTCRAFANKHHLVSVSIADLIAYRRLYDPLPSTGAIEPVPTKTSTTIDTTPVTTTPIASSA
jgi:hypothetical protein